MFLFITCYYYSILQNNIKLFLAGIDIAMYACFMIKIEKIYFAQPLIRSLKKSKDIFFDFYAI
jgi:hypothetical protein